MSEQEYTAKLARRMKEAFAERGVALEEDTIVTVLSEDCGGCWNIGCKDGCRDGCKNSCHTGTA